MADIPKKDLERIEKKLETIEQKIGRKWIVPVVVALIGVAAVVIQWKLEQSSSEARMKLERSFQQEAAELSVHQIFYNDAVTLVGRINGLFKQACYDPNFQKGDSLNDLCIDCFALIDKHRPHYGEEKEFIKRMREYDDLVQENLTDFESGKTTDQDRQKAFGRTKQKYQEVISALDEFYKQYVKDHQSSGQ